MKRSTRSLGPTLRFDDGVHLSWAMSSAGRLGIALKGALDGSRLIQPPATAVRAELGVPNLTGFSQVFTAVVVSHRPSKHYTGSRCRFGVMPEFLMMFV